MLIKGQDASNIIFGNTLSDDGHAGERFDYCIANPPFGVDWTKIESAGPHRARRARASTAASAPACRASPTASCSSCCTSSPRCATRRRAAAGSGSSTTARRSSPAAPAPASPRSAATCSRTTCSRRSSPCPSSLLQHRHQHLRLAAVQPQDEERRGKVQLIDAREQLREDAQVARREAPRDQRRADRRDHPAARRVRRGRARQDRRRRVVRLPHDHRRAAAARHATSSTRRTWDGAARRQGRSRSSTTTPARGWRRAMFELGDGERRSEAELRAAITGMAADARRPEARRADPEGSRRALPRPRSARRPCIDRRKGNAGRRPRPPRHRERSARRGRRGVPGPRGPPPRPGRLVPRSTPARSATRFRSPGCSTSTRRRGPAPRSRPS